MALSYFAASMMSGSNAAGIIGLSGLFAGIDSTASQTSGIDLGNRMTIGMPNRAAIPADQITMSQRRPSPPRRLVKNRTDLRSLSITRLCPPAAAGVSG